MALGREQEAFARTRYETKTGAPVDEVGLIHTADRLFGVSPDGLIGSDGALEIKTMYSSDTLFRALAGGDISEYIDQCYGYMWLLGVQWVDLCLWAPDLDHLKIQRVTRNESAIEKLEADLLDFGNLVNEMEQQLTRALAA